MTQHQQSKSVEQSKAFEQSKSLTASKISRRSPEQVMRLNRLGSFHQSRLSFMRVLTRRLSAEQWRFDRREFCIDDNGFGHAVYSAIGPKRTYSLVAFAHDLPDELRSDRVIAEQWDTTFALFDGVPNSDDIARLANNVPKQEAGRVSGSELTLSRANRSVRLWEHVVDKLANGEQPDKDQLDSVGYLMRTTAVYGSGKFGAADRHSIADRDECRSPFQVEMLTVYLIRTFVRDLVQHVANTRGGEKAVTLDAGLARSLGIGNSTGLGMAPFILNHPALFHNWIIAREESIAQVRSIKNTSKTDVDLFLSLFERACDSMRQWQTQHDLQKDKVVRLQHDLQALSQHLASIDWQQEHVWDALYQWCEQNLELEAQEFLASLMLEPYGELIDGFTHCMGSDKPTVQPIDGTMMLSQLSDLIDNHYDWAKTIDWSKHDADARVWYVSEEKLEPRLGERREEPLEPYEQPLSPARDVMQLREALQKQNQSKKLAAFLLEYPEHRYAVRRVQTTSELPYAEIRDNTIASSLLPIDMLRCKLSFFGAIHFDPRSDRWVRIRMFGSAPYPEELTEQNAEFWPYPDNT